MTQAETSSAPAAGQVWSASDYEGKAGFVAALGEEVLTLLAPRKGEKILDLGCGDGVLTRRLTESGAEVTGLEPSPELATAARGRGLDVIVQDAHEIFGDQAFDAVFSNAAFHWLRDPERVMRNAFQALKPGGRLVVEQGGFGNVVAVVTALHAALEAAGHPELARSPWDFPLPETQAKRLARAGFALERMEFFARPTPLAAGMEGWIATFAGPYLQTLPEETRMAVTSDAVRRLSGLHDPEAGWFADYVRLRFIARRPG